MENEIWKPVPGYEEYYEVSNIGRVKKIKGANAGRIFIGAFDDYMYTTLTKDKKGKFFYIHRLVAMAFIPNPENKPFVNHIDGNKLNNKTDNLEWVTAQENVLHAWRTGLYKPGRGMTGKHHTEETRKKIGEASKGRHHSKETLEKISEAKKGKVYVNNGIECHTTSPDRLQEYFNLGYVLGKPKRTKKLRPPF